jgi:hypothetical protein
MLVKDTVVGDPFFGPKLTHKIYLFFEFLPARVVVGGSGIVFTFDAADADAEPEATIAERLNLGGLLGDDDGLSER